MVATPERRIVQRHAGHADADPDERLPARCGPKVVGGVGEQAVRRDVADDPDTGLNLLAQLLDADSVGGLGWREIIVGRGPMDVLTLEPEAPPPVADGCPGREPVSTTEPLARHSDSGMSSSHAGPTSIRCGFVIQSHRVAES